MQLESHLTNLPLEISCFIWCGPGQHSWVTEAGSQQCSQYKQKKCTSYHWDCWGQVLRQKWTTGRTGRDKEKNVNKQQKGNGLLVNTEH